jgi:hypothetical protein
VDPVTPPWEEGGGRHLRFFVVCGSDSVVKVTDGGVGVVRVVASLSCRVVD